jgi:putative PIN family toxin of toxin-antitoxin system
MEEIIEQQMGILASENALGVLENLPNVQFITNYYKFNLLKDPDDNKFVDCAISSNADFIVTHDSDFDILRKIEFPKVMILNTSEFKAILI